MQRDLRFVWPRAENNLYADPENHDRPRLRLLRLRTARQTAKHCLLQHPAGRQALAAWLGTPPPSHVGKRNRSSSPSLLPAVPRNTSSKTFVTSAGTRPLAGRPSKRPSVPTARVTSHFLDRTHINVVGARLLLETARLRAGWADQTMAEVQNWHTTAEPQDHAATLAALKAEIAAGAP